MLKKAYSDGAGMSFPELSLVAREAYLVKKRQKILLAKYEIRTTRYVFYLRDTPILSLERYPK
ncbi:MAG: hypothetical protein NPIRA01_07610 [Nitrospirales bacterium]|nr:MAG: hypothetical protein NPIRA01_07610 [Nitrospirales bacterium]